MLGQITHQSAFAVPRRAQVLTARRRTRCRASSDDYLVDAKVLEGMSKSVRCVCFAEALKGVGPLRWIVVGNGGILETVQEFDAVKVTTIPNPAGEYELMTLASESKEFECHINLQKLTTIEMVASKARQGNYKNYVIRFKGADSKALATALLPGQSGEYDEDALELWMAMQQRYGELQQLH